MKTRTILCAAAILAFATSATAFTGPGLFRNIPPTLDHYRELYRQRQSRLGTQIPMNPGPAQPPTQEQPSDGDTGRGDGSLTISDVLPKTRSINIFAGLTRDVSPAASRLESTKPIDNTTLLAPLNSAMQALPRKPWEDREDDTSDVRASSNEDKAAQNLQRFVLEHMIPKSPWKEGDEGKTMTLGGQEMWWENRDGKKVVMPANVEVDGVVGRVGNGEIWALRGVVNYKR